MGTWPTARVARPPRAAAAVGVPPSAACVVHRNEPVVDDAWWPPPGRCALDGPRARTSGPLPAGQAVAAVPLTWPADVDDVLPLFELGAVHRSPGGPRRSFSGVVPSDRPDARCRRYRPLFVFHSLFIRATGTSSPSWACPAHRCGASRAADRENGHGVLAASRPIPLPSARRSCSFESCRSCSPAAGAPPGRARAGTAGGGGPGLMRRSGPPAPGPAHRAPVRVRRFPETIGLLPVSPGVPGSGGSSSLSPLAVRPSWPDEVARPQRSGPGAPAASVPQAAASGTRAAWRPTSLQRPISRADHRTPAPQGRAAVTRRAARAAAAG